MQSQRICLMTVNERSVPAIAYICPACSHELKGDWHPQSHTNRISYLSHDMRCGPVNDFWMRRIVTSMIAAAADLQCLHPDARGRQGSQKNSSMHFQVRVDSTWLNCWHQQSQMPWPQPKRLPLFHVALECKGLLPYSAPISILLWPAAEKWDA